MTLQQFAERYRLRIKKDDCKDEIIPGKLIRGCGERLSDGHHIYPLMSGVFAVYLNFPTKKRFNGACRLLCAAGAAPAVVADYDGIFTFDPENETLVKLVLKVTRCRVRRQLTEEQNQTIRQRFKR